MAGELGRKARKLAEGFTNSPPGKGGSSCGEWFRFKGMLGVGSMWHVGAGSGTGACRSHADSSIRARGNVEGIVGRRSDGSSKTEEGEARDLLCLAGKVIVDRWCSIDVA